MLRYLTASREMLLQAVEGLSAEQRTYRPAEDRWSVVDCVEHITVVENNILKLIERDLQAPPPADKPSTEGMDQAVLERVPGRQVRVKGPEPVMPKGRWPDYDVLLGEFEAARGRSMRFAKVTQADLRAYAFPHPFLGPLDFYQWLLFLATHCERHVNQMEEVKSDPAFPSSVGSASA